MRLPLLLLLALAAGCQPESPAVKVPEAPRIVAANNGEDSGAVSSDTAPAKPVMKEDVLKGTHWPPMPLTSGTAWISCVDGAPIDAGTQLLSLDFLAVSDAMQPCTGENLVHVAYQGKISGEFTALVQRVTAMSERLGISEHVLDIDSTGGRIEDAMPAGDFIAESHWLIRVRDNAICHSACVLVLAAGDDRDIQGRIGIHRMVRVGSKADTRAEVSQELREVYGELKEYLERNGASVAVADLMMTVPNRRLRLLTPAELQEYGLSGRNAVQDDLDRIRLARKCGDDFIKRADAFRRDYALQCMTQLAVQVPLADCGADLLEHYGFPDATCPAESPKLDVVTQVGGVAADAAGSNGQASAGNAPVDGASADRKSARDAATEAASTEDVPDDAMPPAGDASRHDDARAVDRQDVRVDASAGID